MNLSRTSHAPFLCSNAAFDVVAMAASAGGVEAIGDILGMLPTEFPAAILVQMHLNPSCYSYLREVLQRRTSLRVCWAEHDDHLSPGTVTLAPPGKHLRVTSSGRMSLISWEHAGHVKPTADGLFESVAKGFKRRALGVVLTGCLSDGAKGTRLIQESGGRVLAQSPSTATATGMPLAAIATGCVDLVLPLRDLPAAIVALVGLPPPRRSNDFVAVA